MLQSLFFSEWHRYEFNNDYRKRFEDVELIEVIETTLLRTI